MTDPSPISAPTPRCCSAPDVALERRDARARVCRTRRSPRKIAEEIASRIRDGRDARRGRRRGLHQHHARDAWFLDDAAREIARGRRRLRRRPRPTCAERPARVRLRQPDRPADGRHARHGAYGDCSRGCCVRRPPGRRASTTSTTPAARWSCSAPRSCARAAASRCPRTATRAPRRRARDEARARPRTRSVERVARPPCRRCSSGIKASLERLRRHVRLWFQSERDAA